MPDPEVDYGLLVQKKIDAVYVTRFQKERWTEKERPYPKIDAKFLGEAKYSEASVMHPLPRVNELDASFDSDRRAIYFPPGRLRRSGAHGAHLAAACICTRTSRCSKFAGGFAKPDHPVYAQPIGTGMQCGNANCIVCDPAERQYAANKFHIVEERFGAALQASLRLLRDRHRRGNCRAFRRRRHDAQTFSPGLAALARAPAEKLKHLVIHCSEADAMAAGFQPREAGRKVRIG